MGDCPEEAGCLNNYRSLRQFALLSRGEIATSASVDNVIQGNVGADSVVGLTDANIRKGRIRITAVDTLVGDALGELDTLYADLSTRTATTLNQVELGGQSYECGVYRIEGAAIITSDITVNGTVIFQITGALAIDDNISIQNTSDTGITYFVVDTVDIGDSFSGDVLFIANNDIVLGDNTNTRGLFSINGDIDSGTVSVLFDPLDKLICEDIRSTSAINPDCVDFDTTQGNLYDKLKQFAILADGEVTITGSDVTGCVSPGTINPGTCNDIAVEGYNELLTLYNDLIGRTVDLNVGTELGDADQAYLPAVYKVDGSATISEPFRAIVSSADATVVIVLIDGDLTVTNNVVAESGDASETTNHLLFFVATGDITISGSQAGGNYIAQGSITVTNSTIQGSLYSTQGSVTLTGSHVFHDSSLTLTCGDPHILCLDGSRLDVYDPGFYRLFTYHNDHETVIINAEIVRNKKMVDLYKQAWIYCQQADRITRMQLTFLNKVVEIKDLQTGQTFTVPKWEQAYTTLKGEQLSFIAESTYNTIGLSSYGNKQISFSGLFAGDIKLVDCLYDSQLFDTLTIRPNFYDSNAIISASALPHIKTVQGKEFKNRFYNIFRLLEWKNESSKGIVNVELSVKRYVKSLYIESVTGGHKERHMFRFEGKNHWEKKLYVDDVVVTDKHYVFEQKYQWGDDQFILFRVQNNGSVSAAFRNVNQYINGLFLNNPYVIHNIKNTELMGKSIPVHFVKLTKSANGSLWQRYAEPFLKV